MPILMRLVRAAMADATVSGAETSARVGFIWISASHTASRPHASAAAICSNNSAKAAGCETDRVDQNSWKMPNSIYITLDGPPCVLRGFALQSTSG